MKVYKKFGKKSSDVLGLKKSFFKDNEYHFKKNQSIDKIYVTQDKRSNCKACGNPISGHDFVSRGVSYGFCSECGHLNGIFKDSDEFANKIYSEDDTIYGDNYSSESKDSFNERVARIYEPKADFLFSCLEENNEDVSKLKFVDMGAGAGYFVSALNNRNVDVRGYEVSKYQIDLGNKYMGKEALFYHELDELNEVISNIDADVISLVGVLEHLTDPRSCLEAIKNNKNIKYLFFLVPTFSISSYFDHFFPEGFNRQLGGGHTHLYTNESIEYFCNEYGFSRIGEWWFGSDLMDLLRHGSVKLSQNKCSEKFITEYESILLPRLDDLQMIFDKSRLSSEANIVLKV